MKLPSLKTAFLTHLGISILIFLLLALAMVKVWYPGQLFFIDGGWEGLKIIAPIDLILGPALTLAFYRPWKKTPRLDMAMIATVQILALGYGIYAVYHQRTAAIVFAENRFETLSLSEFKAANNDLNAVDITTKDIADFGEKMPIVVFAEPYTGDAYGQYLADVMNGLPELRERSDRYQSISNARDKIAKYRIGTTDTGTTIEVQASSQPDSKTPAPTTEIYTIKARYEDGTIEFDPSNFEWINIEREQTAE